MLFLYLYRKWSYNIFLANDIPNDMMKMKTFSL